MDISRLMRGVLIAMLATSGCTNDQALAYCDELERLEADAPSGNELAAGGSELRTRVAPWLRGARQLQIESPDEIKESVATTVEFFTEFMEVLAKHRYDLEEMSRDPAARRLEAREGELAGAQHEIHAFNIEHCPSAADSEALGATRDG